MGTPEMTKAVQSRDIRIRPLLEPDLKAAEYVIRLAFGTYIGLPDPLTFMGDCHYSKTRWVADPTAVFCAEAGDELLGSVFAADWGSVGIFGPLTVHPAYWDRGIATRLLEPVVDLFAQRQITLAGLCTFPTSPKHIGLYQKFGYMPRFLTMLQHKSVTPPAQVVDWSRSSELSPNEKVVCLQDCREVSDAIYDGLDLTMEINSVDNQKLGDTVLVWDGDRLAGFAVCHWGAGTEAGSSNFYIKFATVRPGSHAERDFQHLLIACETLAAQLGMERMAAGVNTGRHEAYRQMLNYGFKTVSASIIMQRPNVEGYNRPGVYAIDDWR